jgi:hypothetical protein
LTILPSVVTETPRMAGVAIVFFHGWPHGAALLMVMTPFSHCAWCGSTNHLCHYLPSTWIPYKACATKDTVQEAWRIFGNKKAQPFVGCFCETQSECPWKMNWWIDTGGRWICSIITQALLWSGQNIWKTVEHLHC